MTKERKKKVSLEDVFGAVNNLEKKFDEKFDVLDKKFDALAVRVENLERSHRDMGLQLDRLEHKVDLCIEGFGALNERMAKLEDRVTILEDRS